MVPEEIVGIPKDVLEGLRQECRSLVTKYAEDTKARFSNNPARPIHLTDEAIYTLLLEAAADAYWRVPLLPGAQPGELIERAAGEGDERAAGEGERTDSYKTRKRKRRARHLQEAAGTVAPAPAADPAALEEKKLAALFDTLKMTYLPGRGAGSWKKRFRRLWDNALDEPQNVAKVTGYIRSRIEEIPMGDRDKLIRFLDGVDEKTESYLRRRTELILRGVQKVERDALNGLQSDLDVLVATGILEDSDRSVATNILKAEFPGWNFTKK